MFLFLSIHFSFAISSYIIILSYSSSCPPDSCFNSLQTPPFYTHQVTWIIMLYTMRLNFGITVAPVIHVPNQLVGAPLGTDVALECFVEASPKSINYWVTEKGQFKFLL